MTTIKLTQSQINKVLAEHCNVTDPPIDPPIDPPVDPPVDPPIPVPPELMGSTFEAIWQTSLANNGFYSNANVTVNKAGISIAILLPTIDKNRKLKITRVENTTSDGIAYGVLSDRRDFDAPFYSERSWGIGGSINHVFGPADSGKIVYANIRFEPYVSGNWLLTTQAQFK